MKIVLSQHDNHSQFILADITEQKAELLQKAFLTKEEETLFLSFKNQERQMEWLAVRALLNDQFQEKMHIGYQANGKPFLKNGPSYFSISHTAHFVALMWSDTTPVGIDVQMRHDRILQVADKFLSEREHTTFQTLKEEEKIPFLTAVWTAKEAAFKIVGESVDFREHLYCRFNENKTGVIYLGKQRAYFFGETTHLDELTLTWLRP